MEKQTYANLVKQLSTYDIITFDVFDTLITRNVVKPVDVFLIVEAKAQKEGIINRDFFHERQLAEQEGYRIYGDSNNFNHIYKILEQKYHYTHEQCRYLMNTEFFTELEITTARSRMLELVQYLISQGKQILLCSDMYLSSDYIRKLLVKCGFPEDLELWVSNERGASKHSGTIWEQLFSYLPANKKIIHVGDNEWADYRSLKQIGKDAILIDSGISLFKKSELYEYLFPYLTEDIGSSLILGYLINKACFNSPFIAEYSEKHIVSIWMGFVFACFMDWIVNHKDDTCLLFITREGYLLKTLYERYCKALNIVTQDYKLFYASRAATLAATITSENSIKDIMQFSYEGTLGHFVKSRMNFNLPLNEKNYDLSISLPAQTSKVMKLLKPYYQEIIAKGKKQHEAYQQYILEIRNDRSTKLTVVDVGYTGTIQYALSKILSENVGGMYMYLNEKHAYKNAGCKASCLRRSTVGIRPIYHNLLFLEAAMQVPYGQLQEMTLERGTVKPIFNEDANFSEYISVAQEYFCNFTEWIGMWKNHIGKNMELNFELAEAIWICLLKFNYLPQRLLDSFWLADDFAGHPLWKYDNESQKWISKNSNVPLSFMLQKSGEKVSQKQRLKEWVKRNIPEKGYSIAQKIWQKFIK